MPKPKVYRAYATALLSSLGALILALMLQPVVGNAAVLVFVVAVTGTALYAGLRHALLCMLVSLTLIDFFLLLPAYSLAIVAETDMALLVLFLLSAGATSWMADRVRKAREIADRTAAQAAGLAALLERQLGEVEKDHDTLRLLTTINTHRFESRN